MLRKSFDVVATSMRPRSGYRTLDLRNAEAVDACLREIKPDRVVALAAYRDPDFCEEHPEETRRLNTEPYRQMFAALPPEVPVLFVSTDYVFDGQHPPYREDSARKPPNLYGQSKKEAEDLVLARPGSTVLRVPLLMGWTEDPGSSGFFSQLVNDVMAEREVLLDHVLKRYPVWTRDVGEAIRTILVDRASGVFHYSTTRALTRYLAAVEFAALMGRSARHLKPSREVVPRKAKRPDDAFLSPEKWTGLGYVLPHDFKEVAALFVEKIRR